MYCILVSTALPVFLHQLAANIVCQAGYILALPLPLPRAYMYL